MNNATSDMGTMILELSKAVIELEARVGVLERQKAVALVPQRGGTILYEVRTVEQQS